MKAGFHFPSFFVAAALSALVAGCQDASESEETAETPSTEEQQATIETGRAIAKALKESLGSQLKAALQAGGPVSAIQVCRQVAIPLTAASGADLEGVAVRRTTLKPRNPANAPDDIDRKVLEMFETAGDRPAEHVEWTDSQGRYYQPLAIQEVCLKCHGDSKNFPPELSRTLGELYPEDQATDYSLGDFRGVIRVDVER